MKHKNMTLTTILIAVLVAVTSLTVSAQDRPASEVRQAKKTPAFTYNKAALPNVKQPCGWVHRGRANDCRLYQRIDIAAARLLESAPTGTCVRMPM